MNKLLATTAGLGMLLASTAIADPILFAPAGPASSNAFYTVMVEGAIAKAEELGVEMIILAPPKQNDIDAQITIVEDQMAKGIAGMVIDPGNPDALRPVVTSVVEEGVPVVFVNQGYTGEGITLVGTDNEGTARAGGEYLCANLPTGSEVVILTGNPAQLAARQRADGSRKSAQECGLHVVAELSAKWDRFKAQNIMNDVITRNPDIKGVMTGSDSMALGAAEALIDAGMIDQVLVVGFDGSSEVADSIIAGEISASVAQNPFNMGGYAVESLVTLINGGELPSEIDTGSVLVTIENAADFQ